MKSIQCGLLLHSWNGRPPKRTMASDKAWTWTLSPANKEFLKRSVSSGAINDAPASRRRIGVSSSEARPIRWLPVRSLLRRCSTTSKPKPTSVPNRLNASAPSRDCNLTAPGARRRYAPLARRTRTTGHIGAFTSSGAIAARNVAIVSISSSRRLEIRTVGHVYMLRSVSRGYVTAGCVRLVGKTLYGDWLRRAGNVGMHDVNITCFTGILEFDEHAAPVKAVASTSCSSTASSPTATMAPSPPLGDAPLRR
jgi:hypothetical protein